MIKYNSSQQMTAQDSLNSDWTIVTDLVPTYFIDAFWFTNDSVFIGTAAYIAFWCRRRCLLLARIHGNACWFHSDDPVSKSLQLPFPYPWTRLFNTQRWFESKNRISAATCSPIRFLETGLHVTVSKFSPRPSFKTRDLHCVNTWLTLNKEACTHEPHIQQKEL
jgi:hypothetical protein